MSTRIPMSYAITVPAIFLLSAYGCTQPHAQVKQIQPPAQKTLSADSILRRCANVYAKAKTAGAEGSYVNYELGQSRELSLRWETETHSKARVEVDSQIAVIQDGQWWLFDVKQRRFIHQRPSGHAPHDDAAQELINAAMLPGLKFVLESKQIAADPDATNSWSLAGISWHGERPCYRLQRDIVVSGKSLLLRFDIDQDYYHLRAVELLEDRALVDPQPLSQWSYDHWVLNEPVQPERFAVDTQPPSQVAQTAIPVRIRANGTQTNRSLD